MYLLAIDIGNTSTSFGVFCGAKLLRVLRCDTDKIKIPPVPPFSKGGVKPRWGHAPLRGEGGFNNVIISSVVPKADKVIKKTVQKLFKLKPVFITHKNAGMKIGYSKPKEIGADRLVNAVAAWQKYHKACIVVDFGTATTLDYIDSKGVYWGGPIAPGIGIANEALYQAAAKLPRAKIAAAKRMLPRSTKEAIQAGIYQGYIGMVEHLIRHTIREVGGRPKIIATGGFAPLIAKGTRIFNKPDPYLILSGLQMIGSRLR